MVSLKKKIIFNILHKGLGQENRSARWVPNWVMIKNRRGSGSAQTLLLPSTTSPSLFWTVLLQWRRSWCGIMLLKQKTEQKQWIFKGQQGTLKGRSTPTSPAPLSMPPTPSLAISRTTPRRRSPPWPSNSGGSTGTMLLSIRLRAWRNGWGTGAGTPKFSRGAGGLLGPGQPKKVLRRDHQERHC